MKLGPSSIRRLLVDLAAGPVAATAFRNKLARGIDRLRGGKSLTHTQALDLRGYENAVADSGGQLEVLNTFRGPPLKAYVRDTGTEGSDALALTRFVSLNRHLSPTVADTSPVGNFDPYR